MSVDYVKAGSASGAKTRVDFPLVVDATDGITAETGEAGGQPQISVNGAAWTSTGIGTLTSIGNGSYYADLTALAVAVAGVKIRSRYKSSNTAEARGTTYIVTALDPFNETQTVSLGSATIGSAQIADGAITAAKFGAGAVTSTVLADGAVTASKLADGIITATKIASNAFTSAKFAASSLLNAAIGTNFLAASNVDPTLSTLAMFVKLVQVDATHQQYVAWYVVNGEEYVASASIDIGATITVTKSNGTILINAATMTAYGTTGSIAYSASGGQLLNAGEIADVLVVATITGAEVSRKYVVEKNNNT